jgi:AcrR family transcriptional regulator
MSAARGRHAPPPEVRLPLQRERLLRAAAFEFARTGYAGASSESISRAAGMSKATFYEHFANKEECMLALFDFAAAVVSESIVSAAQGAPQDAGERMRAGARAFLGALSEHPEFAQTLLVEIIGAGPRAAHQRDAMLGRFAAVLDAENAEAARRGLSGRFASPHDAFAVIGAITELVSRQLRTGVPAQIDELTPVIEHLIMALVPDAAP